MEGWIRLSRKIQEHWIWKDPVKLKWWIDILVTVNHSDTKVNIGMELYECKRGQSVMSLSNWAKRWGASKDSTRNFLNLLQKDGMILHENLVKTTRITVCNYDSYQTDLHDKQTTSKRKPNASRTQAERDTDTNNNDKNDKNDDNEKPITDKPFNFLKSLLDLGVEKKIAKDWMLVRKNKNAANTETAFNAIAKEITISGLTANECIEIAVVRSWQGFKAEWLNDKKPTQPTIDFFELQEQKKNTGRILE